MLVTNSWECPLLETFKLICTRILCLITLNRYSRVTFSYQHVEKNLSIYQKCLQQSLHTKEESLLFEETSHRYEVPKDISLLSQIFQIVFYSGNACGIWLVSRTSTNTSAGSLRWQWPNVQLPWRLKGAMYTNWVLFRWK